MGEALAAGLAHGPAPDGRPPVVVVETVAQRREELAAAGVTVVASPGEALAAMSGPCAGAVIAVKPNDVEAALAALAGLGVGRVLSIAAGVTLENLERWAGPGVAVLRAMPNTPALVGCGASALAAGRAAGPEDLAWAEAVLGSVGTVTVVAEAALDAVTGLSGSGPAYVFLIAEALIDAGVLVGLPRATARDLAVQTLLGSARLLVETGDEPSALRAAVTSPGGTTAAGLRALERAGVRSAILDAVSAATERARQLGQKQ